LVDFEKSVSPRLVPDGFLAAGLPLGKKKGNQE
jgi:hypothetical protein